MKSKNNVREADELASGLWCSGLKDVLKVRRFTAKTRTVVNDLAVDFSRGVVNERHNALTRCN